MRRSERISAFAETMWDWYLVHKRRLPWRDLRTADASERACRILVSEVMLQQTQVERVKEIYIRFLKEFPTLHALASASSRAVIIAWRGMGYNSRALRLRDAARKIVEECGGIFPDSLEALESIKGIGHYTAAAIRNFAFNLPTPCIDTNIRRILHRTFVGPERPDGTWKKDDRYLLKIAEETLDAAMDGGRDHDARNWHAALMDFGSLVQTKKNPRWDLCPLTAKGIMKATSANFPKSEVRSPKSEPGRKIASRFVPNRIMRGRIVGALRDAPSGITLDALGRCVAADWSHAQHRQWLQGLLRKLEQEKLVARRGAAYVLHG
ncbi:MAG TPA: A/G-specific adenine glycosylase [Candidatus Peribacter riflensis]|uniref:Adenine DNA glycosylase n=1 Tax=Candidatus Peribacter riflensis TaxID=1735162 RepID=A0A0S1SS16_9BACT|nr:MAG: A/G-specific adenine glycosylase [Candidatus Peribacter riflensis]OGJ77292.1 MAG: hypothetical protein A2398_03895 [Candidatus Peribacteria bacterium RIFOXYB1_FULL_57_12]OGJ81991.1 MAG: hypothetical protein A2412_00845 [Candidatus Peribacteria bacterium RIFOXYC1_FULL_58_8]ALM10728.1 MAG: A/G-specific adenine glycosylase [Candidatus Peribacter riflensis]ALM11830.1 MAG: A/G-specific adenine glycosylase [Candidatus Peribacter riflensis]